MKQITGNLNDEINDPIENDEKVRKEFLKYTFTRSEKEDISIEMARNVAELQDLEDQKKAVTSDFKSKIDQKTADINRAAVKLNNGYEMRYVECKVVPNYEKKVFTIIRLDNNQIVRNDKMSADDLQMKLDDY